MQAEHSPLRGGGYIVSPLESSPKISLPIRRQKYFFSLYTVISECTRSFLLYFFCTVFKGNKKVFFKALSVGVALSSVIAFFSLFTFSTGIYCEGEKIGICHSEKEFFAALDMANNYSYEKGKPSLGVHFQAYPVISLRCSVLNTASLKNAMLISSPYFDEGCTVYSGNEVLFKVKDEKTAREIVQEYVFENALNKNASLETNLTYETSLLCSEEILSKEESKKVIDSAKNISVVSVVNSYTSKTLPFETQTENDANLYIGESVVVSEGTSGTLQVSKQTVYKNKSEQSSRVLSEKIINEPIARVVRVGIKKKDVLKSGLFYPLSGTLSSPFGSRWGKVHEGIDIAVNEGTPVKAAECGTVSYVNENYGSYGKFILIDHGSGIETAYAHLSQINVKKGQNVSSDTVIALSGNTGRSTGPHLHFELLKNKEPLDPMPYLKHGK